MTSPRLPAGGGATRLCGGSIGLGGRTLRRYCIAERSVPGRDYRSVSSTETVRSSAVATFCNVVPRRGSTRPSPHAPVPRTGEHIELNCVSSDGGVRAPNSVTASGTRGRESDEIGVVRAHAREARSGHGTVECGVGHLHQPDVADAVDAAGDRMPSWPAQWRRQVVRAASQQCVPAPAALRRAGTAAPCASPLHSHCHGAVYAQVAYINTLSPAATVGVRKTCAERVGLAPDVA